ncbi:MAG: DUF169 domain-containing protein [Anaerolineae bacterium]
MDVKEFDAALTRHLRPHTFPLAIRMVREGEELPERVKHPFKDLGVRLGICQGFSMARRYGWVLALGGEDISCPPAKAVFGFAPRLDYFVEGHLCAGMYTETPEAGAVSESLVAMFNEGQYAYILIAPLHHISFEPDVILIYGSSAQVMRLVAATLWKSGGYITSRFSGRADCSDSIIHTMKTGQPQVILPCYGDRIFGQTEEHEMAFSLLPEKMGEIVEGFEGTHKGGIRYPIPSYLRYTAEFPPQYARLEELWEKGE